MKRDLREAIGQALTGCGARCRGMEARTEEHRRVSRAGERRTYPSQQPLDLMRRA
jgi:hypothetical protein